MNEAEIIPATAQKEKNRAVASNVAAALDRDTSFSEDNACVVCFKNVEIYSIGDCDHPVCYECSTRMRVLCQQNECPICRHVLSKVLFTYEKLPYREMEVKNRSEFYSKKYRIGFCNAAIQQKFFELLDHPCPKCNTPPYRTFQGLRNHVRKEHDLHYCDLCTDNLKIFTFERRCYTQSELTLHRTKGDPDNRSHRGHPLCEYCNKRYLDRDELFRHLRREHYFCHFCDADGCNEFYKDYDALADHFRRDHFLCEEGKCATEQFVGAFRTEIDYKAHIANVHGKSLNKQQARQARTLQLEITLGPRGCNGQPEQDIANLRSRNDENQYEYINHVPNSQTSVTIDAGNEEEFPSLGGVAAGPNVSLVRPPPPSIRNRGTAGLARTKENFPALGGGGGGGSGGNTAQRGNTNGPPVAAVFKKQPNVNANARASGGTAANASNGMVIHVSNRPTSVQAAANVNKKPMALDFPALPTSSKSKRNTRHLEEDILPSNSGVSMQNVAAKHRILVDDYVSVANPTNFQKIQMVQKEELEAKARLEAEKRNAPKLTTADFPTLGPSSKSTLSAGNTWAKPAADRKQREMENRKSKVTPAPVLPNNKNNNKGNNNGSNTKSNNQEQQLSKKDKKSKDKKSSQESQPNHSNHETTKVNGTKKEKNNNNKEQKLPPTKSPSKLSNNGNNNENESLRAPPGFSGANVKPPPGFLSNVTVNSVAKLANNLTFTSSLGESYDIVPSAHSYSQPPEATARNQDLVERFRDALKTPEALEEFRQLSMNFRDGVYKTHAYYDHCKSALKDKFDRVFPELLALLPDISKQQELYLAHKQHLNSLTPAQRKTLPSLEVCNHCKQVLIASDLDGHRKLHELKNNFPTLGSGAAASKTTNTERK